jgi:hypothetical protein
MKKTILAITVSLACTLVAYAQKAETDATGEAGNQTAASINQGSKSIKLESGTRLAAELHNTIDVRKARVGDQVMLKTTQAIKSNGHTIVGKGARLVGHVTEVVQKSKDNTESRIGILFDRVERGSLELPISATITSITSARVGARTNDDDLFSSDGSASSSARSSGSGRSSSGSALGGVGSVVNSTTSTVGGLVGGTTSAVGSTVNSTTNVVGNTATSVGGSLSGIHISESSNTSVEGSSILSLQGGNLRLEKGTNFNLVVTQSASAGTTKDK